MPGEERNIVTNGGSAIGEAIGAHMETAVQKAIFEFIEDYDCFFITDFGTNKRTGRKKKLKLSDQFENEYSIDGLIINDKGHPLAILESKYIRYKKHNRDKGSWICNSHTAIRKKYKSIRSSIAVLAGNWSRPSLEMLLSYNVQVFLIPFDAICDLLDEYCIDFRWEENDDAKAQAAWERYEQLTDAQKDEIGEKMVANIKDSLYSYLKDILDDNITRCIKRVCVEFETNKGERAVYTFASTEDAIRYIESFDIDKAFDASTFVSIYENVALEELFPLEN